ncbi:DUF6115 domain-containing protein [Hydrogenimonas cancrithermarum]|uniref:Periplasmic protein n=1 Tax=Hydrogenimonas cancrithermarum TaxID=2993563 RepID=A0ABM8FNH1_9BACT|nr:hypothetical protein [Hydrogenimonas cancrithermarum]BDY13300.1 hypothetical protein HCR_16120 [Hydrogenimonas cancrithermarum]
MNETVLMIAGLAGVMLITLIYMAIKDKETGRKLAMMEAGIDSVNQEIFKLSRTVDMFQKKVMRELDELSQQTIELEIDERVIGQKLQPLALQVQHLQEQIDKIRTELQERVERLDGKVRQVTFAAEHAAPDEQKILQLHAQGLDSASIAKQLRLGKGEVELVLKFSKIHA